MSTTTTHFAPPDVDVSIVIPVYNERSNLTLLFQRPCPVLNSHAGRA